MKNLTQQQKEALGRMMVEGFRANDPAMIEGSLKRGADPDVSVEETKDGYKRPVIHWGVYHFNKRGLEIMLDYGADIEAKDASGETALIMAIRNFKTEAVEFLMRHGADPLASTKNGDIALDIARNLSTYYDSQRIARDKIMKLLTADYGQPPEPKPEAPPTPVSFDTKSKPGKLNI